MTASRKLKKSSEDSNSAMRKDLFKKINYYSIKSNR
jgi:hypothetical protein